MSAGKDLIRPFGAPSPKGKALLAESIHSFFTQSVKRSLITPSPLGKVAARRADG